MDMLTKSKLILYYKRPEIQKAIVNSATNKEVAISYGGKGYGKRPDMLKYPNDVLEMVMGGATSFHVSEELWNNPLQIKTGASRKEMDELRKGWDLVLDIDCPCLEYSAVAAVLLIKAIKYHGVKSVTCKFSGNHGFHIAVPFEAFPQFVEEEPTKNLFPEGPRRIAAYLSDMIKEHLAKELLKIDPVEEIIRKIGKEFSQVVKNNKFDPYEVLDVDTILISSRHLYRSVYSLNEKSGLVSIPVTEEEIIGFDKKRAETVNVKVSDIVYLCRENVVENEAKKLIVQAFDWQPQVKEEKVVREKEYEFPEEAIPIECFPPCFSNIMKGMKDGKKRALFILVNYLTSVGWGYDDVEKIIKQWNEQNPEKLREVIYKGQLRYHKQNKKKVLPPNCNNQMYYRDLHICTPDNLCAKIKNPVQYAKRKAMFLSKEGPKVKLSAEQEEFIRKRKEKEKEFKERMKKKMDEKA